VFKDLLRYVQLVIADAFVFIVSCFINFCLFPCNGFLAVMSTR
jgi:hypothetical protein